MLILVPGRIGLRSSVGFTRLSFFCWVHSAGGRGLHFQITCQGMMSASAPVLHFSRFKDTRHNVNLHVFRRSSRSLLYLIGQSSFFSSSHLWMCELDHKEGWALKNLCFWTVVLEKTLESPLDSNEIRSVNPKGNQPWIFIGRVDVEVEAPILWPPEGKSWLIGKDPDAGKDWGQEKGMTKDEMVKWHHWLNGHSLSKLWEIVKDGEAWHAAAHGVAKSGHNGATTIKTTCLKVTAHRT